MDVCTCNVMRASTDARLRVHNLCQDTREYLRDDALRGGGGIWIFLSGDAAGDWLRGVVERGMLRIIARFFRNFYGSREVA